MAGGAGYNFDLQDSMNATSGATGGTARNGIIFNTSSSSFGLVKTLALFAAGLIAYRILRKAK